jgi:hypothetical protein
VIFYWIELNMNQPVILINVFTVAPENQERLIELLTKATNESVKFIKGFISSTLHKSFGGTKVTMYAQWSRRKIMRI